MATSTLMTTGQLLVSTRQTGEIAAAPVSAATERHVSLFEKINMNVFWMAGNFLGAAIPSIVIPSMVVKYFGDANKDINLPLVVIWGTIVSLVVSPLIGAISDHVTFRMGRRRPFLLIGTALTVLVLLAFAFSPTWVPNSLLLLVFALLSMLLH